VRENDIVARYGGEEFAVILPGVNAEGAVILADRIREKVELNKFPNQEIQPKGNLTISVGVATLPEQAKDAKELIYKADTALYTAKRSGRNRVIQFSK
jgi:diguanylate cyclase (GGDEF)-like protein